MNHFTLILSSDRHIVIEFFENICFTAIEYNKFGNGRIKLWNIFTVKSQKSDSHKTQYNKT